MIQVIHRALNILEYLSRDPQKEYFLSEIAENLKLNKATCANIIKTLTARGYVEHEEQRKGYKLGHMVYKIADSSYKSMYDFSFAKVHADRLRDTINENVILSVITNGKRIIVHEAPADQELSVKTSYEQSPYKTTTGRVIIANYTPDQKERFIQRHGLPTADEWPEIRSKEDLIKQLDRIKAAPCYIYTTSRHIASVTVPIFSNNSIVASLGVYLPDIRFTNEARAMIIEEILNTARMIQR